MRCFWALVLLIVWPFVHVRWRRRKDRAPAVPRPVADNAEPGSGFPGLFGADTILRSLILFNLLFAVQTLLDAIYLWGNAALPGGISYADYAHRGAYPLIATRCWRQVSCWRRCGRAALPPPGRR
jgi:Domain of unknown function (DUF4153)